MSWHVHAFYTLLHPPVCFYLFVTYHSNHSWRPSSSALVWSIRYGPHPSHAPSLLTTILSIQDVEILPCQRVAKCSQEYDSRANDDGSFLHRVPQSSRALLHRGEAAVVCELWIQCNLTTLTSISVSETKHLLLSKRSKDNSKAVTEAAENHNPSRAACFHRHLAPQGCPEVT